jgi:hypothetical protein
MQLRADADQFATIAKKVDAGQVHVEASATYPIRRPPQCTSTGRPTVSRGQGRADSHPRLPSPGRCATAAAAKLLAICTDPHRRPPTTLSRPH